MKTIALSLILASGLAATASEVPDTLMRSTIAEPAVDSNNAEVKESAPKFSISPTGRILMDAAAYTSNEKELFPAGVAIPDVRIGVKASYGKWKAKVDIGYSYKKLSLKDIYAEYDFNSSNLIRFGYFVHQFGLQSATSSSMKISMEEPACNEALNYPRLLGAMYVFDKGAYFATASLHAESSAMTLHPNEMGKTGYGGMTRLVWRPLRDTGRIAQIGFSFAAGSAQHNKNDEGLVQNDYAISANFPTRVNSVNAIGATVEDVSSMVKFTPELLLAYGPFALESQYYYFHLNRKYDLPAYTATALTPCCVVWPWAATTPIRTPMPVSPLPRLRASSLCWAITIPTPHAPRPASWGDASVM